jgi:outer membrane protein assembly factor BamB
MFVTAPPHVHAVDISAGKIAWRYDADGPTAHGGVAVGDGFVFMGISNPGKTSLEDSLSRPGRGVRARPAV